MEVRVAVRGEAQRDQVVRRDPNAEFLMTLADQRRLRGLNRLDLAAGKLPEAGHGFAVRSARQQHPSGRLDQRDRDHQHHSAHER